MMTDFFKEPTVSNKNLKPVALIDAAISNLNSNLSNIVFSFEEKDDKFLVLRKDTRIKKEFQRPLSYEFASLTQLLDWISAVKVGLYVATADESN